MPSKEIHKEIAAVITPSDVFYGELRKHWEDKPLDKKLKAIENTLKKLHKLNCVISGDLTIKEQARKIRLEIDGNGGWKDNVWLKIQLGVKAGETDLGVLLTHGKFTDVRLVFATEETFGTIDNKLFHFEGKNQDEQLVYVTKQDIKSLSYSNFSHWSEKWKDLYRDALGLDPDFDKGFTDEYIPVDKRPKVKIIYKTVEETKQEQEAAKEEKVEAKPKPQEPIRETKKEEVKVEPVKEEKPKEVIKETTKVTQTPKEEPKEVKKQVVEEYSNEVVDKETHKKIFDPTYKLQYLTYDDFYEFKDPFVRNFWFLLRPGKKIELARQARVNKISLEAATRLYRDVSNAF